ncbi:MAG: S16 family serine protease, partial [Elusimicrobiota bacterium]
ALLEVSDPEQNKNLVDHYLDVGFDLSNVFFVTTANTTYSIPPTLTDRMEVIRFSGYTLSEKKEIAKRYLIPKEIAEHGLGRFMDVSFADPVLEKIIEHYTQEAGVRDLQRQIAAIARKLAFEAASSLDQNPRAKGGARKTRLEPQKIKKTLDDPGGLFKFLGSQKHKKEGVAANGIGVVTGLAWTEHGGELLTIEVASVPGKGDLMLTGKLGLTMQESAQAAFTYVRSVSDRLGFELKTLKNHDFHLHVPEGSIPKDGPSAGIAMAAALASFLTRRAAKSHLAMTGEVTLMGRVLGIGGLREKLIAAHREGIKAVLIPDANQKDLDEVPDEVKNSMAIIPVKHMDEVLREALGT